MQWIMSKDEIKAWDRKVRKLRRSKKLDENIASILMNAKIGRSGMNMEPALVKGKRIIKFLEERGLLRRGS